MQALIPIYIICHNILAAAGVLFLSAICMYYFLINANSSKENLEDSNLIQSFFITISRVAILTGVWGFLEFQDSDFILKNIQGTNFGFYLWMVMVVFTIPLPPWSRRLNVLISNLPPNLVIVSMILLSAMAYKNIFSFSQIYTSWSGLEKMIFYGLGLVSSIFGVLELFSDKTPHKLPVGMPLFFLSLMLISLGLSQESMAKSAFFLSMLVPASVSFVVCFPSSGTNSVLHKIFYSILFILILGLPGTPIYLVFSSLGSKSIEIGLWTTAIFGLIWFFYFSVNVHFFRTAILSEKDNIKNGSSNEQGKEFLILGILLGLVLIMIGYLTGRLL